MTYRLPIVAFAHEPTPEQVSDLLHQLAEGGLIGDVYLHVRADGLWSDYYAGLNWRHGMTATRSQESIERLATHNTSEVQVTTLKGCVIEPFAPQQLYWFFSRGDEPYYGPDGKPIRFRPNGREPSLGGKPSFITGREPMLGGGKRK